MTMGNLIWIPLLLLAIAALLLAPRWGLRPRLREWKSRRYRRRLEDALKHLLTLSQRGQSGSTESLAGALGLGQHDLIELIEQLERKGLIQSSAGGLTLTPEGEHWAIQIVRAHRLWERYLADEAGMPFADLHGAADRAEHELMADAENIEALDAHLGHPRRDPHGDPIPRADGTIETLEAQPLTDWASTGPARIVHIEDEPDVVFRQILALGLAVGDGIRVIEHGPECIVISHDGAEHCLAPVVAANINVEASPLAPPEPETVLTLADLPDEAEAEVVAIDEGLRGFARRRLLDLGLTPGAIVRAELDNAFGDPRAYRVRGTLVALRRDQACHVHVGQPGVAEETCSGKAVTA